jgi:hypothetical protein
VSEHDEELPGPNPADTPAGDGTQPPAPGYLPPPGYRLNGPADVPPGAGWQQAGEGPGAAWPPPEGPARGGIHPLSASRALSHGWTLFRSRWRAAVLVLALLIVPAAALDFLWWLAHGPAIDAWLIALEAWSATATPTRAPDPAGFPPFPADALWLLLVVQIVQVVVSLIAGAAVLAILGWAYGGGVISARQALGTALSRTVSLVVAWLVMVLTVLGIILVTGVGVGLLAAALGQGLGVFVALIALVSGVVATIFVMLRWTLATYVIVIEGHGPLAALGRSWRLVAGSTWRVLGYVLLVGLILLALALVFGAGGAALVAIFGAAGGGLSSEAMELLNRGGLLLFSLAVTPWTVAILMLLYFDLRLAAGEQVGPPAA